jgi:predicted RNA-binding protein
MWELTLTNVLMEDNMTARKEGDKFVVRDHKTGRKLGEHKTMTEAQAQLRAIKANKSKKKGKK